jgi:hypothetical protein
MIDDAQTSEPEGEALPFDLDAWLETLSRENAAIDRLVEALEQWDD